MPKAPRPRKGTGGHKSKYRAVVTYVDGHRFASKKEAKRYSELRLLEQSGEIFDLELQPVFPIKINFIHVCDYRADFRYKHRVNEAVFSVTEDTKGFRTDIYRLKKKLVEALYIGLKIVEV